MKSIILSVILLTSFTLSAQIEIGQKAPPLVVNWVDNPNLAFKDLKGKAIVLDFWFTSCAPCVYTIPHLNDLAEKYENEDIAFVAISFEEKPDLSFFLDRKKLLANVGSDTSYQTINQYGVESYPTTFLIDKNGIVQWEGHAGQLISDQIDLLLGKQFYSTVEGGSTLATTIKSKDFRQDLIYPITVEVNNYMNGASGMQFQEGELSIVNNSLPQIISTLIQKNSQRIEVTDTTSYDVRFKIPEELPEEKIMESITKSLANELNLKLEDVSRNVLGYELTVENDSLFLANAIDASKIYQGMGSSTNKTHWKGSGVNMTILTEFLENRFGIYVADKTRLNGFFEFKVPLKSIENAKDYLLSQYGLMMTQKEIEVIITKVHQ